MLEANKNNSLLTIESSSIRLSNEGRTWLFPFITFSFAKDCSISNFHKIVSKDNTKNNYSSTNYAKKNLIRRKKEKKKDLQTNGFKGSKKTFTNNGI